MLNKASTWSFALLFVLVGAVTFIMKAQLTQSNAPSASLPRPVLIPGTKFSTPIDASLWRNDHEVLCFRAGNMEAVSIDARSGVETPLTRLSAVLSRNQVWGPFAVSLSPDGKWLLWRGFSPRNPISHPIWIAAALDGSRVVTWRRASVSFPEIAWMPDNKHWIEVPNDDEQKQFNDPLTPTLFYSLDTDTVKTIPLKLPRWVSGCWFTPNNHLIVASLMGGSGTNDVYDFAFPVAEPVRKTTLSLPATDVNECALSPQGNQFLWQLYKVHLSPRANLAQRVISLLSRTRTTYTRSFWVSNIDGGGLRQITPETERLGPGYAHWLPNGKHIGYRNDDEIWSVPIPAG